MVKASISTQATYSITIEGLTEKDLFILRGFMQNSPNGYNPNEEPEAEWELRKAIHDACLEAVK